MDKKTGKNWNDMHELLSRAGSNLNILEEEVDLTVQKEYFEIVTELSKNPKKYKIWSAQYVEEINNLFDESINPEIKKRMLVILATIDDIAVYRAIESFSKTESPLKKWAVIALQQSRMLIQSNLMDDPGVFISTGLGGQDGMLRYFCVLVHRNPGSLQEFQRQIITNETESAFKTIKGTIEQIGFYDQYSTLVVLLPLDADLKEVFIKIIDECNLYGNFLHDNMIVTNIKKLTHEEIRQILQKR